MGKLDGRVAFVTGAGRGIGAATALRLAEDGAHVILADIDTEGCKQAAAAVEKVGSQALAVSCNVADREAVETAIQQGVERFGRLDILVNNAGVAHVGSALTTPEEDFDRLMQINVRGVYLCTRSALGHMRTQGGGVILNMGSVAGMAGLADRFAYSTSKGAVLAMTMSVARDFVADKIRCNAISPARVHTPFVDGFLAKNYPGHEAQMMQKLAALQPVGRMGEPDEVANLAVYLCSDEASFITGVNYPIDGGFVNLHG